MISIAGSVYLLTDKNLIGIFLFSFGLIIILNLGFLLYASKIRMCVLNKNNIFYNI